MMKNMKIKILITFLMLFSFVGGFRIATIDNIKHRDVIELNELDMQLFGYAAEGIALAYGAGSAFCYGDSLLLEDSIDKTQELNEKVDKLRASRSAVISRIGL